MDWLASDAQAMGQEGEAEQPAFDPALSSPLTWPGFSPATSGLATAPVPPQSQFAAPALPQAGQQAQLGTPALQEPAGGVATLPGGRPTSGHYSLRPRSVRLAPISN